MSNLLKVSDLFEVNYGVKLELVNLIEVDKKAHNSIPFVSRTENNNGVSAFVERIVDVIPNLAHTLSVAAGGSVLSTFYHPYEYYSGHHIYVLKPLKPLNPIEMLIYARYINANKFKYNYGRQANKTLGDIKIPSEIPTKLINEVKKYYDDVNSSISSKPIENKTILFISTDWRFFKLGDLFDIVGTRTTTRDKLHIYGNGPYPYVTTKATNNGVDEFYDYYTEEGNVITFDSAVLGYCSYQPLPFSASDHVEKLIPKFEMNRYIGLFLVTVLNLEQYRYNYGRKCSQTRLGEISIKLPVKGESPDFVYMEKLIKSMPFSSSL